MSKRLQLAVRNAVCTSCRLSSQTTGADICVTGSGPDDASVVVVTKFPVAGNLRKELETYFTQAGFDPTRLMWCSALKCRTWDLDPNKSDQKACRPYLTAELDFLKPQWVLALGNEPLFAATGKSGIMKYRGSVTAHSSGAQVFATISPSMVTRNPGLSAGFLADLRYFHKLTTGDTSQDPLHVPGPSRTSMVGDKKALRSLVAALITADAVSYDIETTGASEFDTGAALVSMALTLDHGGDLHVWNVPLCHPDSPWLEKWTSVVKIIGKPMSLVPKRIAHNAKFDTRWLRQFGVPDLTPTFDTIIAAALLDENRPKGLKPLALELLGADPWSVAVSAEQWWLVIPLDEILEYNGLDTWHTMRLYRLFKEQLIAQPRIARLFKHLMMPAVRELIGVERRGVWVDKVKMYENWEITKTTLAELENQLYEALPEDDDDIPVEFWTKKGDLQANWNASNFLRWFLFDYLELPVLARGKQKDNGDDGAPSVAEAVMMNLAEMHPVPEVLLERVKWNKFDTSFFTPYSQQLDSNDRLHTTFKPWGTVTGRLSSGGEDKEKITSTRKFRGVNLQQVPRDSLVRGLFGAPPGSSFIEADYSQVELRVAAFIAREKTMLHLYATGQDIHTTMAMKMTGKGQSQVTKEERKAAKAVNFGFLYGMGWNKFIATAWSNYGLRVSEEEARAFRKAFFDQFPMLMRWHAKQRRLATQYGRVETPMGRVRHLPDIKSPSPDVRAEAERQAINSPVQAFASDMALLSLVLISEKFRAAGIDGHPIGAVHDAVNFEIRDEYVGQALPLIKDTMENLPLQQLFGINLDVPIVADLKRGAWWGGAREIPGGVIHDPDALRLWLQEDNETHPR